jgi:hypothetical protein
VLERLISRVVDFHGELLRNIKGIRIAQSLFDDLSSDLSDQKVAIAAESSDRIASANPLITRPLDYGSVITYPFVPLNWHATRFSDGLSYGVWYGSLELKTTVYETVYHWHRFVMDSFAAEDRLIRAERRVFRVRCDAILIDLRGRERRARPLLDRRDYTFAQQLGSYLKAQGQNGLLVGSARCAGQNAAIMRPEALSAPRDVCYLTYSLNPTQDQVRVERTPGRNWLTIRPTELLLAGRYGHARHRDSCNLR